MSHQADKNEKKPFDEIIQQIADYVIDYKIQSEDALKTAHACLLDTLGCGVLALTFPECRKLLGPVVPDAEMDTGVKIPGTSHTLDPVQAAFNIGCMIRWLDFNDTWLAAEWGHPSDNLGAILATTSYANQHLEKSYTIHDVLHYMIKAHEIQGVLALENSFNRVGLDHVVLVKVASTAIAMHILGGNREDIMNAVSQAWVDGQALRTYRHAPNTGSRKSWAAGDATARGVRLALITHLGEKGYPSVLTAPNWGFYDVLFKGHKFKLQRDFGEYVMENILFKISFPAEFHAQTAVEAAVKLHEQIQNRLLDDIESIYIETHESAIRIISKDGPLHNPADRDHCLQYMVAVGLIEGDLRAEHYEDEYAGLKIDKLREKMVVVENPAFSKDYHDPEKRSIANTMQIKFTDGTFSEKITVEYPIGHKRRREEGIPVLIRKFKNNLKAHFDERQADELAEMCLAESRIKDMPVHHFLEHWYQA